jgi:hypothetical protein
MRFFERERKSDEIEESFLKIESRIRIFGMGGSEVICLLYTQIIKLYQQKSSILKLVIN